MTRRWWPRPWALRALALIVVTMAVAALALEGVARRMELDLRQGTALWAAEEGWRPRAIDGVDLRHLDYLPAGLSISEGVLLSRWGECALDTTRPTLLALGDSTTVQTSLASGGVYRDTWPMLLPLGPDAQRCVLAEVGYHPSDLAALVEALGHRLRPDRTVVLLCGNDLGPQAPRRFRAMDGQAALVSPPTDFTFARGTWNPWLARNSEAYRFLSWQLALRTGDSVRVAAGRSAARSSAAALRSLASLRPLVVFLPSLDASWRRPAEVDALATAAGVPIETVPAPPDPIALRREPSDFVHLSAAGHAWVAAFVERRLAETAER